MISAKTQLYLMAANPLTYFQSVYYGEFPLESMADLKRQTKLRSIDVCYVHHCFQVSGSMKNSFKILTCMIATKDLVIVDLPSLPVGLWSFYY